MPDSSVIVAGCVIAITVMLFLAIIADSITF